ncbi:MAG TPA: flagellar hook-basal body complex protein FliE [Clostridiales bacterium]|nr:flagellar hook-basal body complex protein FliE [Clostridiales bacterium]
MSIDPITSLSSLEKFFQTSQSNTAQSSTVIPFQTTLENALNDVKETSAAVDQEIYNLATGQTNNLHDLTIASTKANLSVELFVQLRNKALDSYQEIMRMSL